MSSKFSRSPVPRRRPPICIAPHGSCRSKLDISLPLQLHGLVIWHDPDPLAHIYWRTHVWSDPRKYPATWWMHAYFDDGFFDLMVKQVFPTPWYNVNLYLHAQGQPPGEHLWAPIFINPFAGFTTGPLSCYGPDDALLGYVFLMG